MKKPLRFVCAVVSFAILAPAFAEPPPHAKAHGWRKKNDPDYVGYTGKKWNNDYGVIGGRCNTKAVGAVVGGVVGGVAGSRVADREDRAVAIILGTAIGAIIGAKIGEEIDNSDRACMGHALELAAVQKTVAWKNPSTGVSYRLTPTRDVGDKRNPCREFTTQVSSGKKKDTVKGVACRQGNGEWVFRT